MEVGLDGLTERDDDDNKKEREKLTDALSVHLPLWWNAVTRSQQLILSVFLSLHGVNTHIHWHEMRISVTSYRSGLILEGFNLAHEFMTVVNTISVTSHTHMNKCLFINFDVRAYCDICRSHLPVNNTP